VLDVTQAVPTSFIIETIVAILLLVVIGIFFVKKYK